MDEIKTKEELDEEVLNIHGYLRHFMFDCQACPDLTSKEKKKITELIDGDDSMMMRLDGVWSITNPNND